MKSRDRSQRSLLIAVRSSSIHHVGYDPASQRLLLEYEGGRWYEYFDVPEEVYVDLMHAESMGRYVNYAIKPHYHFHEIATRPDWVGRGVRIYNERS